jgi:molybdate transport system substrate-binding protein
VKILGTFPDNTHPPIIYPAAATAAANTDALAFLNFLKGPAVDRVFEEKGFRVLVPAM